MRWKSHVQCESGEKLEITSNSYLSIYVHFQFNQEFIKKLNLEVGRLRGWLKTPQEAAEEFDITLEEANKYWKSTYELLPSTLAHLLPQPKKESSYKIETIENDEIGLYENEVLIYKSNMGAVLALTEISLEDIPEDISKKFMDEVFKNCTSKQNLTISNDELFDVLVDNIIDVKIEPIFEYDSDKFHINLLNAKDVCTKEQLEKYDNSNVCFSVSDKNFYGFKLYLDEHLKYLDELGFDYTEYTSKYKRIAGDKYFEVVTIDTEEKPKKQKENIKTTLLDFL